MRSPVSGFLLAGALAVLCDGAAADYLAYSVSDAGKHALPEAIGDIEAKYLLNVEWGMFGGRKARLGVLEVDNNSASSSFRITAGGDYSYDFHSSETGVPVNGIEAIVTDVLASTGRFRLVERKQLDDAIREQDLAASGRVAKPSGAATGKILGAEYLVQVVVTDYEPNFEGKDIGVGALLRKTPLLGGVKVKSRMSRVGMNFRLIDAETTEVVFTQQVESIIKESGLAFGGLGGISSDVGLGGFMSSFSQTPVGQAVIAGINKGVYELAKQVGVSPAEGSVVKADPTQIYVNIGEDSVSVGERVQLFSRGEELIDPETGISLGGEDEYLGDAEVVDVKEKFSIVRPVSLTRTPDRGDKVVSGKQPEPLQFASTWDPE